MSEEALKKPVHIALLRPTQLERMAAEGKIPASQFGVDPAPSGQPLPVEQKVRPFSLPKAENYTKLAKKQVQLRVLHDNVPAIPADKQPPCSTCKTATCCVVFVVNIEELEYESGVYGDSAVKLTPEMFQQLNSRFIRSQMITAPRQVGNQNGYYLEGKIGEPCPFLNEKAQCSIYDIRPKTCRTYSCVGDSRITEGMRQGTEPIDGVSVLLRNKDLPDAT